MTFYFSYLVHPRKRITEDGQRLSRHLKNRGRPVNTTWTKYKAQLRGKKVERREGISQIFRSFIPVSFFLDVLGFVKTLCRTCFLAKIKLSVHGIKSSY